MMKHILLVVLGLVLLARFFTPSTGGVSTQDVNFPVPEFYLETLDGQGIFTHKDLANGTSLLTFMSYTCGYCSMQSKYMSKNGFMLPVYLVSVNNDKAGVENWYAKNNIKPYYKKFGIKGNSLGSDFDVSAVPVSFIIKDGVVVKKIYGMIDESRIPSIENIIKTIK